MWIAPFSGPSPRRERARVGEDRLDLETDHERRERVDRRHLHVVAAPAGEREAVALLAGVGAQDHVGGGVVRVDVHGV
jgi:hypothetical protein